MTLDPKALVELAARLRDVSCPPRQRPIIDEAAEALASAGAGDGWRPIETAPKGRQVLAGYRNELGNWRTIKACYYLPGTLDADESCDDVDEDGYAPEGWYEESETHDYILPCQQPTHWMPLPAARSA